MSLPTRTARQRTTQVRSCLEFEVPSQEFVLDDTLATLSTPARTPTIRLAPTSPPNDESAWPSLWVHNVEHTAVDFESLLSAEPDIIEWTLESARGESRVYQPRWSERARERFRILFSQDEGTMLEDATASDDQWSIRLTVPTREAVQHLYDRYRDSGFTIAVKQLYEQPGVEQS